MLIDFLLELFSSGVVADSERRLVGTFSAISVCVGMYALWTFWIRQQSLEDTSALIIVVAAVAVGAPPSANGTTW